VIGLYVRQWSNNPQSLLDVGYGSGSFLKVASQFISQTYRNDINGYPIPECSTFVENIHQQYHNIVTFFDSLEHFPDIYFLDKLKCKYICISVPWCHYFSLHAEAATACCAVVH